ncbi:MAG: phospho-N-acetylmuramoyl-pentapeptide-transferase [Micromonosporaceae bacterium]|nr:phospho-N-acetylmuramoyl-pentapeptide-transferase [Micromonosporaceae bacterium]
MRSVIVAAAVAFVLSIFGTPLAIKAFTALRADQPIRAEGPQTHLGKKGTPTMGGVVFILSTVLAYIAGHVTLMTLPDAQMRPSGITATGVVLLGLFVGTGLLGFLDDYLKVAKRNSAGISKRMKLIGQTLLGSFFGIIALYFPSARVEGLPQSSQTVASDKLSFIKDLDWAQITKVGAVIFFIFVVMAMSNAVNFTDGLDGLATGASVMVIGTYGAIAFWQYRHWCADPNYYGIDKYCYAVRDPLEIALIAGAASGALIGFLWWNTSPARIFMGDTGALALGSLIASLAAATRTLLLLPLLGMLFTIIMVTWCIQIGSYRLRGKRVFRMVPLQHHFELAGWSEVNIVVRFWIIAGTGVAAALGLFYTDFLTTMSGLS